MARAPMARIMGTLGIVSLVGFGLLGLIVVPTIGTLFIECLAALAYRPPKESERRSGDKTEPIVAVLIPAHDEEASIQRTLRTILPQTADRDRVIVVADNCSDATAKLAREEGAEVVERFNANDRGKGFALAHGIDHLRGTGTPDVVVVIDADTDVAPGTIRALGRECHETGRPVQAVNLLLPPENAGYRDQISAFAFRMRNLVRPLGQSRLGQASQLMGTGMALPWEPLSTMDLASSNLVEDMQLGIDFAIAGMPARFNTTGKVSGVLPTSSAAATTQRKRWEHGHIGTILQQVPRLVGNAIAQRRVDLLWLAMDTAVPPLALLAVLWATLMVAGVSVGLLSQLWWPAMLAVSMGGMLAVSVLIAWRRFATDIPLSAFASIPYYVVRKLPIYLSFLFRRQVRWVRTERV